jgi:hypothetical protein
VCLYRYRWRDGSLGKGIQMKEQLLALAYKQEDEVFGSSERDEFDCLIALIEDGTIDTFEELAKYGVEQ